MSARLRRRVCDERKPLLPWVRPAVACGLARVIPRGVPEGGQAAPGQGKAPGGAGTVCGAAEQVQLPPVRHQAWARREKRSRTQPGIAAEGPVTRHNSRTALKLAHGKGSSKRGRKPALPALPEGLRGWIDNCLVPVLVCEFLAELEHEKSACPGGEAVTKSAATRTATAERVR